MPMALVTGATGFCGRHLVSLLAQRGSLRVIGTATAKAPANPLPFSDYIAADLSDLAQVEDLVRSAKPDLVFHLAGKRGPAAEEVYRANLEGTLNLLEALRTHAPNSRVLLVGSAAEYGHLREQDVPVCEDHPCRPVGAYAASKYAVTLAGLDYAHNRKLKVVVARPFNIVGAAIPESLLVGAILARTRHALQAGIEPLSIKVGDLETRRDFLAVQDVATAYVRMLEGEFWGEVFNLCSGQPQRVRDVLAQLLSCSPRPILLEIDPALLREREARISYGSFDKARGAFGFTPMTPLKDALRAAWDYAMGDFAQCADSARVMGGIRDSDPRHTWCAR